MLDLATTRDNTPETLKPYLRFLTWWMLEHVALASAPITTAERRLGTTLDPSIHKALRYLFAKTGSDFEVHASYVGFSADALRAALLGAGGTAPGKFSEAQRANLLTRYQWYREAYDQPDTQDQLQ